MLDQNDLKQLKEVIKETVEEYFLPSVNEGFTAVQKDMGERFTIVHNELRFINTQIKTLTEHTDERIDTLTSHVDSFITLHKKIDQEQAMMRARIERLEERVAHSGV